MQIEQIRLESVGAFDGSIALRGFSPGLNVLAGPNEMGKSTILKALRALFFVSHTTRARRFDLQPYSGGAPLIGCQFQLGKHGWLLEKRYLAERRADLQRLDGLERLVGADAENRLAELLSGSAADTVPSGRSDGAVALSTALPLLWVEQGAGLQAPSLNEEARRSLVDILGGQAEVTAGLGPAQNILAVVQKELDLLVSSRGARKGGPLDRLLLARDETAARLADAETRATAAANRLAELDKLQREIGELTDLNVSDRLQSEIEGRKERLIEAERARQILRELTQRVVFHQHQLEQRTAALGRHDHAVASQLALADKVAVADRQLVEIAVTVGELEKRIETAVIEGQTAQQAEKTAHQRLARAQGHREAASWRMRRDELSRLIERLTAIAAELSVIDAKYADMAWPADTLQRLRVAAADRDRLVIEQRAGAPMLRLTYSAGCNEGFRIGDTAIKGNYEKLVVEPLAIDVAGVGRIEIVPAMVEQAHLITDQLADAEARLIDGLSAISARDLAEAEAREAERTNHLSARDALVSERDALAPNGRDVLLAELEQLETQLSKIEMSEHRNSTDCIADNDEPAIELKAALEALDQAHSLEKELRQQKANVEQRRSEIATELRITRTRQEELDGEIRGDGADDVHAMLTRDVEEAREALNRVLREQIALRETAIDDAGIASLSDDIAAREKDSAVRARRLLAAREQMGRIEGELARDFEDGVGEQVDELKARHRNATRQVAEVNIRVEALRLLIHELSAVIAKRRNEISAPLSRRMTALAAEIWPSSQIALTPDFDIGSVTRGHGTEELGNVSDGTREQLALLARLAYADLIADSGEAAPLILDDPLVYSDDTRLTDLFRILKAVSARHQVIVLTCHERAFAPLVDMYGAYRVQIERAEPRSRM